MPEEVPAASALELRDVEQQYGALRPLRIRHLRILPGAKTALMGFDGPAAETLVNLASGTVLPEKGEVRSLGQSTSSIADSDAWLAFVERIGMVSDRIVLLDAMTIAQNLAIPFDLEIDPIPPHVLALVTALAAEVEIDAAGFDARVSESSPEIRAKVRLARALALDPAMLILEHPTATLNPEAATAHAALLSRIWARRGITMIALTLDEKFARTLGGRLLEWQPATGELRERSGLRFW